MKLRLLFELACAIAITAGAISFASADDTGLAASLHELKKERGKLCMANHYHTGLGEGQINKRQAIKVAIQKWEEFTSWEYGSDWGKFRNARSKGQRCTQSGKTWACSIRARPCKR